MCTVHFLTIPIFAEANQAPVHIVFSEGLGVVSEEVRLARLGGRESGGLLEHRAEGGCHDERQEGSC